MSVNSERVKRWRKNTKRRLVEAFGGKCAGCSYARCDGALEFHHLDSAQKDFALSNARGNIVSWERIVAEIRKCVMLCSCCHKEVHCGYREVPDDAPRFDEEFATYKHKKEQLKDTCPICGGEKLIVNLTCSRACAAKKSGKVDWTKIDVVALYTQHQNYSKIGGMLGVTGATIKRRLDFLKNGRY